MKKYGITLTLDEWLVVNLETKAVLRSFKGNDTGKINAQQCADALNDPNFTMIVKSSTQVHSPIVSVQRLENGTLSIRIDDASREEFYVELIAKGPDIPEGIFTSRGGSEVFLEK